MSSEPPGAPVVISVQGVGKRYEMYDQPRDRLLQLLAGHRKQYYREFWALRDINFEVERGAALGILGRNGSGKSTLLQLIAGVLAPTTGAVQVRGRVAALLELGSGFNPEFTGRENVRLNATILGLSPQEVDQRMDEIAAFADIGEFISQPVKTYSSGMMMRLAFAVQVLVDPDILMVDEALAVGDARFQLKCFRRLEQLRARGTTIVFVSHDINQVRALCTHGLVLEQGRPVFYGEAKAAAGKYLQILYPPATPGSPSDLAADPASTSNTAVLAAQAAPPTPAPAATSPATSPAPPGSPYTLRVDPAGFKGHAFGEGGATLEEVAISGLHAPNHFYGGQLLSVRLQFSWDQAVVRQLIATEGYAANLTAGIALADKGGNYLFGCNGFDRDLRIDCFASQRASIVIELPLPYLAVGVYFMTVAIALGELKTHIQLRWYDYLVQLECPASSRTVGGLFAVDYQIKRVD